MKLNPAKSMRLVLCFCVFAFAAYGQSTEFTYQGRLTDNVLPANASYDFEFRLFAVETGGTPLGGVVARPGVAVANGIFGVRLDFGPQFDGAARWIEISVKPSTGTTLVTLAPRQPLTSAPYSTRSLRTGTADSADSLNEACSLCVTNAQILSLDGAKVTGTVANAATAGNISGIVPIANGGTGSSMKNFVDLSTDQTVGGNKTFRGNVSVVGTGAVFSGDGSGLTNLNGANIAGGTVTSTQLSPDTLPNGTQLKLLGLLRWDVLKPQANFPVGPTPQGIAFDGANLWVANAGNSVAKVRARDGVILGTFPVGSGPTGVAFDGANVWVTNQNSNTVTKLRASDGAVLGTFPTSTVGGGPTGIAFDGANIWITDVVSDRLSKLRASDGAIIGDFPGGAVPQSVAFDGANIWVGRSSGVAKFRASDGVQVGHYTNPGFFTPNGIAFDGSSVWVTGSGGVAKLRPSDGTVLGTFATGIAPSAIAFDGLHVWVTNAQSNSVTKLRASDGVNLGTFAVGTNPQGVAFDGVNMWVTNQNSGNVTRTQPVFLP